MIPALNHLIINRRTRRSPMRCFRNLMNHSWSIVLKNLLYLHQVLRYTLSAVVSLGSFPGVSDRGGLLISPPDCDHRLATSLHRSRPPPSSLTSTTPPCPTSACLGAEDAVAFPSLEQGRHSGTLTSELNGWPVSPLPHASPGILLLPTEGSWPELLATFSLLVAFTPCFKPVHPGAFIDPCQGWWRMSDL